MSVGKGTVCPAGAVAPLLRVCIASVLALLAAITPAWADKHTNLSRLVFVGDSLSAGFQNFSLYDSDSAPFVPPGGQKHGYAPLIARQAGIANYPLPLISYPGIPSVLTIDAAGNITRGTILGDRENPLVQTHDLAVPGFTVADALARTVNLLAITDPIDLMTVKVLGFPGLATATPPCGTLAFSFPVLTISEVACAVSLNPTLIVAWIGNNDALQALTFGSPPTNPAAFAVSYHLMMQALAGTGAPVVVANIPDVSVLPFLIPVPAFEARCHFHISGTTAADFVVPDVVNPAATSFDICTTYAVRSAALIASTQAAITAYNAIIAAEAEAAGAVLVDVNSLYARILRKGYEVNGQRLTTAFLGGLFSLDAIHPTNTGYAILANEFIKTMNSELHTGIPPLSVVQVAKDDPLVFGKH